MLFQTSVLSLASGESTRPASAAKRAERTPGAPERASTSRPESSARTSWPGSELGVVDGFERGVFGEGFAVFFGWFDVGEIGERIDGDGVCFGGGAEVAQFALAGGGYVEAKGHQ